MRKAGRDTVILEGLVGPTAKKKEAQLALVVPQFFFPPTSLLGAIGFSATSELYFSYAILATGVVVLTLYLY